MQALWQRLASLHPPTDGERQAALGLLDEYRKQAYVGKTCRAMLEVSDGTIITFYAALELDKATNRQPPADSGWMADANFCFVNVRATGLDNTPGNFIQAAKLLPALRANAIHLAPFTDYDFHTIYAVRSVRTIASTVIHPSLKLSPEDQLRAFVAAAHLLGKGVGFDIEPHVAQFAKTVIIRPELFRWIKLSPDRNCLAWGLSNDEMLEEVHQQRITAEVHRLVSQTLRDEGLDDLEAAEGDDAETRAHKQAIYYALIGGLIERGCWTIPSQSWAADGVPAFGGYDHAHNHPVFEYRGREGEDLHDQAFHILTPYKFYTGMRANQPPERPAVFKPALDYYSGVFTYWREGFGFDFLRHDYADHIFDSVDDDGQPTADRPSPQVLGTCIERSKTPEKPYIGSLAERMENEIEPYAGLGFDLMLGSDMLAPLDAALVEKSLGLHDQLTAFNAERKTRFAVTFAVDTHDTGNPGLWGEPLVKLAGAGGMRARHFLSRFTSAGRGRRPKYEVMGSQDLSYGLYQANISEANLVWVGDETYNRGYHFLEDVYEKYRMMLAAGEIVRRHIQPEYAWWLIAAKNYLLLPVIVFHKQKQPLTIDLAGLVTGIEQVTDYDFTMLNTHAYRLATNKIEVPPMDTNGVRLFALAGA